MAKVFKFSGDPNKIDAGSNFIDYASVNSLPAIVKVKMVTVETEWTSKDGNEGWHLVCEIVQKAPKDKKGRQQQYSQLHRYIMLDSEWAEQRIAELCDAFLGKRPKSLNATTLVGKTAAVKLKGEVYEGEERAKIQRFLELDEAEEDEDDVDPEEEEEDDDVEDEDEDEDEDEEEAEDDEDDYNDWSLVQLRSELKRRELDSKGKKDELVERLQEDDEGSDDEEEDEESDDAGDEEDYSEYSFDELKAEVKRRGLRVLKRHTEDDLIEMLQEDDEDDEDPLDDDE
jgi:hypothetical protein